MRAFPLLVLAAVLAGPLSALGWLDSPGGSWALGESRDGDAVTLLFPSGAVGRSSWLLLPPGAVPVSFELSASTRTRLDVPLVRVPGLRYAAAVPAGLRSVTLRGRLPDSLRLQLASSVPEGAWVAVSTDQTRIDLPSLKVAEGWVPAFQLEWAEGGGAVFSRGEAATSVRLGTARTWAFSPAAWGFTPLHVAATGRLISLSVTATEPGDPIPTDPDTLLRWPSSRWRQPDHEWFAWKGTSVLVLVSSHYDVQDNYLKRLAFYVEKTGYRGRLVSDEEVSHLHGWNAHDYAAPDLARFFTQAERENFPLNRQERELRARLIASGVLVSDGTGWKAGQGALVGISEDSAPGLRRALFVHEAFHGLYFTTPEFREAVGTAWKGLSDDTRERWRSFLSLSRYDPSDEALMVNEFQAYVLQRPESEWEAFFTGAMGRGAGAPNARIELLEAARHIDDAVKRLFGLESGSVFTVAFGET